MKAFLHNIYVLYTIFIISLINFLYLGYVNDMNSVYIFILITILVTFFNKNMIIVLGLAFIVTNILRIGNIKPLHFLHSETNKEGFKESDKEESEESEDKEDKEESEDKEEKEESQEKQPKKKTKEESKKEFTKESKKESTKEESTKKETEEKQPKKKTKEEFHPNKSSLLSSEKKDLEPQDKMIFAQEKLLERMNKYKPLLDTLQGITKNIAFVKGMSNAVPTDL